MANETLVIPEERILELVDIIRYGLESAWERGVTHISEDTKENLEKWCEETEAYYADDERES